MSKIKKLAEIHEKYIISVEHQLDPVPSVKASITIPGEGNTYVKKVSTLFVTGKTLEEAEEAAIDQAISMLLGNKETKPLIDKAEMFDISSSSFVTKTNGAEFGVKTILTMFKETKPYRIVQAYATGADLIAAEKSALKSAVNKALGVK